MSKDRDAGAKARTGFSAAQLPSPFDQATSGRGERELIATSVGLLSDLDRGMASASAGGREVPCRVSARSPPRDEKILADAGSRIASAAGSVRIRRAGLPRAAPAPQPLRRTRIVAAVIRAAAARDVRSAYARWQRQAPETSNIEPVSSPGSCAVPRRRRLRRSRHCRNRHAQPLQQFGKQRDPPFIP